MENQRRSKNRIMGWSQSDQVRCKKHPKHRQSPGVCSFCLRERLSKLSRSYNTATTTTSYSCSSSLSSSPYSSSSSSNSSPVYYDHHRMANSDVKGLASISFLFSGKDGLMKSRSMAFIARDATEGKIKKSGFWSKLLRRKSNRGTKDVLMHSRTMREIMPKPNRVY